MQKLANEIARIHLSNLDFDVILLDGGIRIWKGEAQELLRDNDFERELEEALFALANKRRGSEVSVGGGAAGEWIIRRT